MSQFFEDDQATWEKDFSFGEAARGLLPLLGPYKRQLLLCIGLLAGATAASLAWPWFVQIAIDGPVRSQLEVPAGDRRFEGVASLAAAIITLQILAVGLQYLQRVRLEVIGQDIILGLREKLFAHILSLELDFFDKNPVGRLLSRVESDTESLRLLFTNAVVLVMGDIFLIVGIWAVMFVSDARLAMVVLAVLPVVFAMMWFFHKYTTPRFLDVRKKNADVTATITELLHGMSIVQIFHRGEWARRLVRRANERKFRVQSTAEVAVAIFFNAIFFTEALKVGLVLFLGSMWGVTPGTIILFVLLVWKEFEPIARTADQLSSFQKGVSGARRIFGLLSVEPAIKDAAKPRPWKSLRESIRFENVWFSYTNDETWALKDVSFEVPAGSRAALAGVTGGGKTTVIALLFRMYEPQRGRILVDGIDIREIARDDLRRRFGLVLQDIVLFPGDVMSNLALEDVTMKRETVVRAAKTVEADRFIDRLPAGYETEVSEKGANFSRGERQLLSFARALAADPDVLVLDEATASVDPQTERSVQRSLEKLMEGRTSIVIAHRLSTIVHADQILVLRHGELVEQGRHADLLASDGYYASLFLLQFGEEFDRESKRHAG